MSAGAQQPPPRPGLGRRLLGAAVGLMLPVLLVPLAVGMLLGGAPAALGALLGSLVAFLIGLSAGWRTAAVAMPGAVAVTIVAAGVQGSAAWALLLAVLGLLAGLATHRGVLAPLALTGMLASIVPGTDSWGQAASLALFLALGAVNGILTARRLGVPERQAGVALSLRLAAAIAGVMAAVVGAAGWIAVRWDSPHSYWLPMTVFLIATPTTGVLARHRAVSRLVGTVVAVLAVAVLIPLSLPRPVDLLLAMLLLLLSLVYAEPLWCNAALSAAAVVLLLTAAGSDPGFAALDRLGAVVVAAGLVLAGTGAIMLADRMRARPGTAELVEDFDPAGLRDA